jgi:hypothetical protein
MNGSVIVWDLETVPDLRGFAVANGLAGKTDQEVREAIGDKLPKHVYHSIVCIGGLVAHSKDDHWAVEAERTSGPAKGGARHQERELKEGKEAIAREIAERNRRAGWQD